MFSFYLQMQWDEDTWVDISDPPSPVQEEARSISRSRTAGDLREPEHDLAETQCQNHGLSFLDTNLNERLGLHGAWRLLSHIEPEASQECIHDSSDLDDLHKLAQELLESYQELANLAHKGDIVADTQVDHTSVNLTHDADSIKRISHLASSASEPKSFKADSIPVKKSGGIHSNRQTNSTRSLGRKKTRDKSTSSNPKTKEKLNTTHVNISTKVPQPLCKNKTKEHNKKSSHNNCSSIKPSRVHTPLRTSVSCDNLSEVSSKKGVSERKNDLHEYRKLNTSTGNKPLARYSIPNKNSNNNRNIFYYQHSTTRNIYNELYEEEEDKAKAIVCVLFCLMGVGLIVGLVCLLSHYVEEKELEQMSVVKDEENSPDVMSEVYYHRVADVIRLASQTGSSQYLTYLPRPEGQPLKPCPIIPVNLRE
ncbi:hypothetical protein BsWGS_12405 [Bradybaena similaris]